MFNNMNATEYFNNLYGFSLYMKSLVLVYWLLTQLRRKMLILSVWQCEEQLNWKLPYYNIDKSHHTDITTQHSNKTAANNERCSNATRN